MTDFSEFELSMREMLHPRDIESLGTSRFSWAPKATSFCFEMCPVGSQSSIGSPRQVRVLSRTVRAGMELHLLWSGEIQLPMWSRHVSAVGRGGTGADGWLQGVTQDQARQQPVFRDGHGQSKQKAALGPILEFCPPCSPAPLQPSPGVILSSPSHLTQKFSKIRFNYKDLSSFAPHPPHPPHPPNSSFQLTPFSFCLLPAVLPCCRSISTSRHRHTGQAPCHK